MKAGVSYATILVMWLSWLRPLTEISGMCNSEKPFIWFWSGSCYSLFMSPYLLPSGHSTFSDRLQVHKTLDVIEGYAESNKIWFEQGKNERS